jgi:CsoR family transcriptional regulator, copper-sensing transcriptional repressor
VSEDSDDYKKNIQRRLNKIEGQVKGIQRMVESEKTCVDILTQIAAIRAAINKVGSLILERYSKDCINGAVDSEDKDIELQKLMDTIQKFLKFAD